MTRLRISRRSFLRDATLVTGGIALGPTLLNLAGCGNAEGGAIVPGSVVVGLYDEALASRGADALRQGVVGLDWSWLSAGDSVLVKVASNSANPHPATTSPEAVRGLVAELLARGAGRIVVADQAGVESVRLAVGDVRFGSTRAVMAHNGLLAAIEESGAEAHFFDESTFDGGYFPATLDFAAPHWSQPMYLPNIVREVDHIVYLPRLSSHALAGYTHGHKVAMGWLRDDSRFHVHHDAASLHEKYVEISYCREIRERLRLTVTLAEALLLDFGPDEGTVAVADPRIVIASDHLANHDAVSVAVLGFIDDRTEPSEDLVGEYDESADLLNSLLVRVAVQRATGIPWGDPTGYTSLAYHEYRRGLGFDRALDRAYQLVGGVPSSVAVSFAGRAPCDGLRAALAAYGGGLLDPV